jgi:hypothetical protein
MIVTNIFALPYKLVCSKFGDSYRHPIDGLNFYNLCKIFNPCTLDVHINTTIEVDDVQPCYAHVKGPWLLPLFKLKEYDFIPKYFNERAIMIELLGNLKITRGSNWRTC